MAEVLLARASGIEGFERHVVIKRIHPDQARDERFVAMFLDEARLAAALHHQNVVQVHDIGEDQGEYFFAMEYVHGEDLRKLLMHANRADQTVPLEHLVTIITGAAAGLHYAHEQRGLDRKPLGIVHRDVSPANILIGYDGAVKVADFGIAKAAFRTAETQSGILKGKVSYMSPEQCTGKPVDRRSDVFALGIVLYELATVRRLFKGDSDYDIMSAIVHGTIPPPTTKRADIPPALEQIILKALALDPALRYQSAHEMRLALEAYADAAGLRTSTSTLADYMTRMFGERAEPWLVDDAPAEASVDFDGSASGIVEPLSNPQDLPDPSGAQPNSLIANARQRATGAPTVVVPSHPAPARSASASGFHGKPATGSDEALAWAAEDEPLEPARPRRPWFAIGVGVAAVITLVFLVTRSASHESEPGHQPSAPLARPTPVARPSPPAPPATPAPSPPAPVVAPPVAVKPVIETPAVVKPPPPVDKPRLAPEPPKPPIAVKPKPSPKEPAPADNWDPNSLFPK